MGKNAASFREIFSVLLRLLLRELRATFVLIWANIVGRNVVSDHWRPTTRWYSTTTALWYVSALGYCHTVQPTRVYYPVIQNCCHGSQKNSNIENHRRTESTGNTRNAWFASARTKLSILHQFCFSFSWFTGKIGWENDSWSSFSRRNQNKTTADNLTIFNHFVSDESKE